MYSILIFTVVGLIVGLRNWKPSEDTFDDFFALGINTSIGTLVGMCVAIVICAVMPRHWVETGRWPLASMRTVDGTSEYFVECTGSVHSSTRYRVLRVNPDGSLSPLSVKITANNTEVNEDAALTNEGSLTVSVYERNRQHWLFNWSMDPGQKKHTEIDNHYYEFAVPKGSVRNGSYLDSATEQGIRLGEN